MRDGERTNPAVNRPAGAHAGGPGSKPFFPEGLRGGRSRGWSRVRRRRRHLPATPTGVPCPRCAGNLAESGFSLPGAGSGRKLVRHAMNSPLLQLLVRWLVLALGVMLATKIIPGIACADGATLIAVVLLLSFLNLILKPLLVLFT